MDLPREQVSMLLAAPGTRHVQQRIGVLTAAPQVSD
jgi:hypothetical protein